jgi:anhydro-N-acetylmuramic acid kinase
MQKKYTSLGLMSGTSGDGVDASIIYSNGIDKFEVIKDKYFEYDSNIFKSFHSLKEKIFNLNDLKKYSIDLIDLERKITVFHAKIIKELELKNEDIIVGFHGQTIFHNSKDKVSKQLGNGKLLNQLTKKKIIFNFRKNDILNGGEGAPLAPIFHQLIATQNNILLPVCFLNIGGISNITMVNEYIGSLNFFSKDIGPGNCLIDEWVRKNSNKRFDTEGKFSFSGKRNQIIFEQAQELYSNRINKKKLSFDTSDFDISFVRGLSLEDGTATLTDFTASIIGEEISSFLLKYQNNVREILLCGGGRKNKALILKIKENLPLNLNLKLIDDYNINGDFIESQAFGFLAIRSVLNLPISFPNTTGCKKPCTGGEIIKI